MAVLYDWERGVLEALWEGALGADLATQTELDSETEGQRRIGGPVDLRPGELLTVRMPLSTIHAGHNYWQGHLQRWRSPTGQALNIVSYKAESPAGCTFSLCRHEHSKPLLLSVPGRGLVAEDWLGLLC